MSGDTQKWGRRPLASAAVKVVSLLAPLVASFITGVVVDRLLPPFGTSLATIIVRWLVVVAVSTLLFILTDRQMRKMLPLAALLSMTMAFPDKAPSRFKVARRSAGVKNLDERVRRARQDGISGSPVEAAEEILILVSALTDHDSRTRGHSERTHLFTSMLARELHLSERDRDRLTWAALVHDIGKIEVSPDTLNKPGKPTEEEWTELRAHPGHGARICEPLADWLGEWYDAIGDHHERWDGAGYPHGKAGTDISYGGRIVCVADAYEVMTTNRTYKRAMSPVDARAELVACSGAQFDPAVVRAFLNISLGDLRSVSGPFSWLLQLPFLDGLGQTIGRIPGLVQVAAGSFAVVGTAAVAGLAPGLTTSAGSQAMAAQAATVAEVEPAGVAESGTPLTTPGGEGPEAPPPQPQPDTTQEVGPPPSIFEGRPVDAVPATARPEVPPPAPPPATPPIIPTAPTATPGPTVTPDPRPTPAPVATDPPATAEPTAPEPTPATEPVISEPTIEPEAPVRPEPATDPSQPATEGPQQPVVVPTPDPRPTQPPVAGPTMPTPTPQLPNIPRAPVATSTTLTITEDVPGSIDLLRLTRDPDGNLDPTSLEVLDRPVLGTVSPPEQGRTTYTPNPDANGRDTFSYQVCDDTELCDSATVTVVIESANDAPTAAADQRTSTAGDRLVVDVLSNDTDVDDDISALRIAVVSPPDIGTAEVRPDQTVLYTSPIAFNGVSEFTYEVCDAGGLCDSATATITVTSTAVAPDAADDTADVGAAEPTAISVLANDTDANDNLDPTTLTVSDAANGTTSVDSGTVVYTADTGFDGQDEFTYTICDTTGLCDSAIVRVRVQQTTPAATPPVAVDDDAGALPSPPSYYTFGVLLNDTDADGNIDPTTIRLVDGPRRGTAGVTASGRVWFLAPTFGRYGRHTMTYEICDTTGLCDTAELTFRLTPPRDRAAAASGSATLEGTQIAREAEMDRIVAEIIGDVRTPSLVRDPDEAPAVTSAPPIAPAIEPPGSGVDTSADSPPAASGPR